MGKALSVRTGRKGMAAEKEYLIREAEAVDAPAVASLISQLGYPVSPEEMTGRLKILCSLPEYVTFVAEAHGEVIGIVGAYRSYSLEFSGLYGRLTALVVDEGWRGRGVGKMLLDAIETWLVGQGAVLLVLTSSNHRQGTHEFYKHNGYLDTGVRFTKRLR
ncbi:MAG: GNAT family N-acetyltransferase [Methanothrix sp.]|nr:GNAT family N-acetyltransferase [Methanothrix sp.]